MTKEEKYIDEYENERHTPVGSTEVFSLVFVDLLDERNSSY
jgi:hypothetical protein